MAIVTTGFNTGKFKTYFWVLLMIIGVKTKPTLKFYLNLPHPKPGVNIVRHWNIFKHMENYVCQISMDLPYWQKGLTAENSNLTSGS